MNTTEDNLKATESEEIKELVPETEQEIEIPEDYFKGMDEMLETAADGDDDESEYDFDMDFADIEAAMEELEF